MGLSIFHFNIKKSKNLKTPLFSPLPPLSASANLVIMTQNFSKSDEKVVEFKNSLEIHCKSNDAMIGVAKY